MRRGRNRCLKRLPKVIRKSGERFKEFVPSVATTRGANKSCSFHNAAMFSSVLMPRSMKFLNATYSEDDFCQGPFSSRQIFPSMARRKPSNQPPCTWKKLLNRGRNMPPCIRPSSKAACRRKETLPRGPWHVSLPSLPDLRVLWQCVWLDSTPLSVADDGESAMTTIVSGSSSKLRTKRNAPLTSHPASFGLQSFTTISTLSPKPPTRKTRQSGNAKVSCEASCHIQGGTGPNKYNACGPRPWRRRVRRTRRIAIFAASASSPKPGSNGATTTMRSAGSQSCGKWRKRVAMQI
mmetsp:Transcript_74505/g.206971  ORF Transcript_74505/g.206971 Transcript_74505/m.206971 type:complete len:293 (-) Transcript_74505:913-1791(-)